MAERDAWEIPLYRFARLLLRDEAAAHTAVVEVLQESARKRPPHIDPDRLVMLQFRDLRRKMLKGQPSSRVLRRQTAELPANAGGAVRGIAASRLADVLHALPEPGRSGYALLLLDAMESEWIAKLLELTPPEFSDAVHAARLAVHEAIATKTEAAPQ